MSAKIKQVSRETSTDQRQDLVTFRLDQQAYALPITPVNRILEMVAITPVPQVRRPVVGVINLHGSTVPVVDMRQHFGLPEVPWQLDPHIVLVQINGRQVGLIVDEVLDVLSLPGDQITPPANILPEELGEVPLLRGLAHTPNGTVLVLDLTHLFQLSPKQVLAQAAIVLPEIEEKLAEKAAAADEEAQPETPKPARTRRRRTSRKTADKADAADETAEAAAPRRRRRRTTKKPAADQTPAEETKE